MLTALAASAVSVPLVLAGSLALPSAGAVTLRAGQKSTVILSYLVGSALLNRQAPNEVRLQTPWETLRVRPTGTPRLDPEFRAYFAKVSASRLSLNVPANAAPGVYKGGITAQLFLCDQVEKICTRREIALPLTLQVVNKGQEVGAQSLGLKLEARSPLRIWPALR